MPRQCKFNKLKGRIIEVFGSQKAFADAVHRPENTISMKLLGKVGITRRDIDEWAELLAIPKSEYGDYFF